MPSRPVRPPSTTTRSPGCGPVAARPVGGHADAPAEHQRVGGVAGVVEHGAGDGRQADLVAVVGDAVDRRPRGCAAGAARRRAASASGQVGRAEAQDVGDGDRPVGGAEHVADHAADAGVGAAERLDGRRVVVGLGLQGDRRAGDERRRCRRCRRTPTARTARRWRRWHSRSWREQRRDAPSPSSVVMSARNVLWAQCSLHVWASVSSSTSVGSRPLGDGSGRGSTAQLRRGRGPATALDAERGERRRRRGRAPRSPSTCRRRRRAGVELGLDRRRTSSARSSGWRRAGAAGRRSSAPVAGAELDAPPVAAAAHGRRRAGGRRARRRRRRRR